MTRELPHDTRAEAGLLACCLLDCDAVARCQSERINCDTFYQPSHRIIWEAICALADRKSAIDTILLTDELASRHDLEAVGGVSFVESLAGSIETTAHLGHFIELLRGKQLLRRIVREAARILEVGYETDARDAAEFLATTEQQIHAIGLEQQTGAVIPISAAVMEAVTDIARVIQLGGQPEGLPTGYPDVDAIMMGMRASEMILLAARPSVGKCVASGTEVVMSDGSISTIDEIVKARAGTILTLGDDKRLRQTSPSDFVDDGIKPVFRVRTRLGREVVTTAIHPFLTINGWMPLHALKPRDIIAVPRVIPVFGDLEMRECEVRLMAYFLGDGGLTSLSPMFTKERVDVLDDFCDAVSRFGGVSVNEHAVTGRTKTLRVVRDKSIPRPADDRNPCALDSNPVTAWLRGVKMMGVLSKHKTIPACVFRLRRDLLALFLNRLFSTDGWVMNSQIGFCSASKKMLLQIGHLLLRFGVVCRTREKLVKYNGERRPYWSLEITANESMKTFVREIGVHGRKEEVARLESVLYARNIQTNNDLIPVESWELVRNANGGRSWLSLAKRAGIAGESNMHVGKRAISRPRMAVFAAALGSQELHHLANSDVFWDRIESIEPLGEQHVYDLTIPETHNFIANDVCVHNTSLAMNIVENVVMPRRPAVAPQNVLVFSLEMSAAQIARRMICGTAAVKWDRIAGGFADLKDQEKLASSATKWRQACAWIDESSGLTVGEIVARSRRLDARHRLGLVVVDYLQLLAGSNRRAPREEQIAEISCGLKGLAKELRIPVLALSQLNRESERDEREPRASDLRGSGSQEQDADVILLLSRADENGDVVDIQIAKNRNGPTGRAKLTFIREYTRFANYAP